MSQDGKQLSNSKYNFEKKSFWKVQTNKNMQLPDTLRMDRYDMLRCLQKFAIKVSLVQIKTHA